MTRHIIHLPVPFPGNPVGEMGIGGVQRSFLICGIKAGDARLGKTQLRRPFFDLRRQFPPLLQGV